MDKKFSKYFDHTLLKSTATKNDIIKLCNEAIKYDFYSVCVNSLWVSACSEILKNTDIKVCSVVGFPFGATSEQALLAEVEQAIFDGTTEIDMVANPGLLLSHNNTQHQQYYNIIENVYDVITFYRDIVLKVIVEAELLNEEDLTKACEMCKEIGVDFVKTSTGYAPIEKPGARLSDLRLMKELSNNQYLIKASGGIRTLNDANNVISAGADRIGTSASVKIMEEFYDQIS